MPSFLQSIPFLEVHELHVAVESCCDEIIIMMIYMINIDENSITLSDTRDDDIS